MGQIKVHNTLKSSWDAYPKVEPKLGGFKLEIRHGSVYENNRR